MYEQNEKFNKEKETIKKKQNKSVKNAMTELKNSVELH